MKADGIDQEVLESYVQMRREVTKRVDRVVALAHESPLFIAQNWKIQAEMPIHK